MTRFCTKSFCIITASTSSLSSNPSIQLSSHMCVYNKVQFSLFLLLKGEVKIELEKNKRRKKFTFYQKEKKIHLLSKGEKNPPFIKRRKKFTFNQKEKRNLKGKKILPQSHRTYTLLSIFIAVISLV